MRKRLHFIVCSLLMAFSIFASSCSCLDVIGEKVDNGDGGYTDDGYTDDNGNGGDYAKGDFYFEQEEYEIQEHEYFQLTTNKGDVDRWESDNVRTARVDDNGKVLGINLGDTTIRAYWGTLYAECTVRIVRSDTARDIKLTPATSIVNLTPNGTSQPISAQLMENGQPLNLAASEMTWASENPKIATVNQNGEISAVKEGQTVIGVSCDYNGEFFYKEISVCVGVFKDVSFALDDYYGAHDATSTISNYTGDETALGFEEGSRVQVWNTGTAGDGVAWNARVFPTEILNFDNPSNLLRDAYEVIMCEVVFTQADIGTMVIWNQAGTAHQNLFFAGKTDENGYTGTGAFNTQLSECAVLYNNQGERITEGCIEPNKVYTLMMDISELTSGSYGIGIDGQTNVYIANAVACTKAYAKVNYNYLELPSWPIYKDLYFAQGDRMNTLTAETSGTYAGMVKQNYLNWCNPDTLFWNNRIMVSRSDFVAGKLVSVYADYTYYGFDIVLGEGTVTEILFFDGGVNSVHFDVNTGTFKYQEGTDEDNLFNGLGNAEITYFDSNGVERTGSALIKGEKYTFKVKINARVEAFGFAVGLDKTASMNGTSLVPTSGSFYVGRPYFM